MERADSIRRVSLVAVIGNLILGIAKIVTGFVSGSLAVISDGFDTATDVVTSFITYVTARIAAKPADTKHPYGHHRADPIAARFLAFMILFVGAQLALTTFRKFISHEAHAIPEMIAIYVTIISIVGKSGLAFFLFKKGKALKSQMTIANAKNMKNDIIISSAVLIGLFFTTYLQLPQIDVILGFVVALWVIKTAVQIILESNTELMDGLEDTDIYHQVFDAAESVEGVSNPHKARIRKMGDQFVVEIDVEVNGRLSVIKGHHLAHKVEESIKKHLDDVYDVIVHVEPINAHEHPHEKFGVTRERIERESKKKKK